jgi:putative hydrolase of the HAD superfamily
MTKYRGKPQYQCILFDLDETLYPRRAGLMDMVGDRILQYMIHKVGIPPDDAALKRFQYHQKYGTSLRGLMEEYHIDPADFLHFVHDINPRDYFGPSPPLARMLEQLPLRKVIFTNSDVPHSERVLECLQVRAHFELIVDINALDFCCKPDPRAYRRILDILDLPGESCIMLDDKLRNLIPAKDVGMTTILVDGESDLPAVDYAVPTIFHAEQILLSLLPLERR